MTSSQTATSFFPQPQDHLPTAHQSKIPSFEWSQSHDLTKELQEGDEGLEHSARSSNDSFSKSPVKRPTAGQKFAISPSPLIVSPQITSESMKSNPKTAAPREPFVRDGASDDSTLTNSRRLTNRWSLNGSEKLLDPSMSWNLANELGKLRIGDNADDDTKRALTPPKGTKGDVVQVTEASPLDASSVEASMESGFPKDDDKLALPSHSRGSSTDTAPSEASAVSQTAMPPAKAQTDLTKDRPRSFSGAYSDAELRRLQQAGSAGHSKEQSLEVSPNLAGLARDIRTMDNNQGHSQPMFPSLATNPALQPANQIFVPSLGRHEATPTDNSAQLRPFQGNLQMMGENYVGLPPNMARMGQQDGGMQMYRRPPPSGINVMQPGFSLAHQPVPGMMPSPTNFPYPGHAGAHPNMALGNTQQFAQTVPDHNQSLRDAAQAQAVLLGQVMPTPQGGSFPPNPSMFMPLGLPTPPIYASQFFTGASPHLQDSFNHEMIAAMGMPQYAAQNAGAMSPQTAYAANSPTTSANGPSANNRKLGLYKTELCRSWEEKGTCRYGPKCQFAHGEDEVRKVSRHPKYKTEICRTFWVSGSCPYGKRCCFIHTELPLSGAPPGADGKPPPTISHSRERSQSTNSDSNDAPVSLLARISAKRNQDSSPSNATTPTAHKDNAASQGSYQYGKPPTGSLRVDTTVIDMSNANANAQHKSAYPGFTNPASAITPGPVTAAPDFGRQNRLNMMDINQRLNKNGQPNQNVHNGNFSNAADAGAYTPRSTTAGNPASFGMLNTESPPHNAASKHGHSRSGSSSNWGSFSQNGHLAPASYSVSPAPGNDLSSNNTTTGTSWASATELSASTSRFNDRPWA